MIFKKKPQVQIIPDSWEFYTYTFGEDQRALIRFALDFVSDERPAGYDHGRRMIIYAHPGQVGPNGLPSGAENRAIGQLEDSLVVKLTRDRVDCKLAAVQTYHGLKDCIFQVSDPRAWDETAQAWIDAQGVDRFERLEYPGWEFFDDKIPPDAYGWNQISNRRVIDALAEAGSDLDAEHPLEHHFIGPPEALAKVRAALEPDGFEPMGEIDDSLTFRRPAMLDLEAISTMTWGLARLAEDCGASYDGWGTPVIKSR